MHGNHLMIPFACLLLGVTGCGISGSVSTTSSGGGTITNRNGQVTGDIAVIGITLEVREAGSGSAGSKYSTRSSSTSATGQTSTYDLWEITAGEVKLRFEREDDKPVSLTIDGKSYGTVSSGDELLVDGERKVFINGERREAKKQATSVND